MISSHECVNQIETLLASGETATREQVAQLVWAYASACKRLNQKAQQCLDLLRQGRRAEAVRLAKEPPDLGQELQLLDFDQRSAWLDLAEAAGLPVSQTLDANALGNIVQEVATEGSTLERLLKNFRRMSLGQAPLPDRLRLLRQIRQADPDGNHWTDDVRIFEKARLADLIKEAEEADVQGDLAALEAILAEIRSGEWLAGHEKLAAAVDRIALPHRQRYAYEQYNALARDLHDAHGAMDEPRCRFIMDQWEAVGRQTGVEPAAPMKEEVAPVEAWLAERNAALAEESNFQQACAALEQAIDENKDRLTLDQLAAAVFRFERGMPEVLAAQFNTRVEEINRRSRRRFVATLTAIVGGVLLVAAAIMAAVVFQGRRMEHARWQTGIAAALDKGDVAAAGKLLAAARDASPKVYATPEIQAFQHRHDQMKGEEESRQAEWDTLRKKIEEGGIEKPDPASLKRLDELARAPDEKNFIEDWRQKYQATEDAARRKRNEEFDKQLKELHNQFAEFRRAEQGQRDNLDALAAPILETAHRLAAETGVDKELANQAAAVEKSLMKSLATFRETAGKRQVVRGALGQLPSLVDRPDEYVAALEAFAKANPSHPLTPQFIKAAGTGAHWRSTAAWLRLVEGWKGRARVESGPEAAERRRQVEEFLKNHAGSPFEAPARECLAYLEAAQPALADGRLIGIQKIGDVLRHEVFSSSLQCIRTAEGNFYCWPKGLREQRANDKVVGYSVTFVTAPSMVMAAMPASFSASEVKAGPMPAPQTAFAKAALERLDQFNGPGWETFYLRLATVALEQKDMDPVLAGQVLQLLLGFAGGTTPYVSPQLKQFADQVGALNLDFVPWPDPRSGPAEQARVRVASVVKGMGSLPALADEVDKRLKAMDAGLVTYRPVGILMGDPDRVFQAAGPAPDATAYAVQVRAGQAPEFALLGEVKGGKLTGDAALVRPYPPGTVVFVRNAKQP